GRGLGKREDGIAEAIRVRVKSDTAGLGHDAAEPFSFHWWDHVFNASAANIAVEAAQGGVSVRRLQERDAGLSTRRPRRAGAGAGLLYGRFVKVSAAAPRGRLPPARPQPRAPAQAATLTARGEEAAPAPAAPQRSDEDDDDEEDDEDKLDLSSATSRALADVPCAFRRLTDKELIRACGGRTAHKGARHGLTMSAKLARLEQQEREFLA
ncbi:GPTC4 protein, partial [Nothoprocta ornata]|nr:GPTC4 protein [Nothoprocta ornata]